MKFTIGTVSGSLAFDEDIRLIKSSLLYADEIELIGMVEYALYKYLPGCFDTSASLDMLLSKWTPVIRSIGSPEVQELLPQLEYCSEKLREYAPILKKKRTKSEILGQMQIRKAENEMKEELTSAFQELLSHPNSHEIQRLIDKNIITVYDYGFAGFNVNELTGGYCGNLINSMRQGTSFPLFDKTSNELIGSLASSKLIDIGNTNPELLRHAGVATNILMTLPTLESASFDELIDIKHEFTKPLTLFRKGIYTFSEKVKSLPWDKDFQFECLKLYDTEVAPSILEINEQITQTSVLKNLGRKVLADEEIRKEAGWIAGGLTAAITTSTSFAGAISALKTLLLGVSLITIAPEAVKAFLKTANLTAQAFEESREKKSSVESNVMYYYYLASKKLG